MDIEKKLTDLVDRLEEFDKFYDDCEAKSNAGDELAKKRLEQVTDKICEEMDTFIASIDDEDTAAVAEAMALEAKYEKCVHLKKEIEILGKLYAEYTAALEHENTLSLRRFEKKIHEIGKRIAYL